MIFYVPDVDLMERLGFTYSKTAHEWYACYPLDRFITLNISGVPLHEAKVDVIDETFLQPFDYEYYLERNPKFSFGLQIKKAIDRKLTELKGQGVLRDE